MILGVVYTILVFYRREISAWLKLNVCLSRNYYA